MGLVIEEPAITFNLESIKRGDVIWAKHKTWNEGKGGFVSAVNERQIVVQYSPGIGNVVNHYIIEAREIEGWTVRWSSDLTEIHEYPEPTGEGEGDDGI